MGKNLFDMLLQSSAMALCGATYKMVSYLTPESGTLEACATFAVWFLSCFFVVVMFRGVTR